jgi:Tfp pilus assembly protein FimV
VASAPAAAQTRARRAAAGATRLAEATRRERSARRYRVRPGDTLWDIARAHETSVRQLLAANRMRQPVIRPASRSWCPRGSRSRSPSARASGSRARRIAATADA